MGKIILMLVAVIFIMSCGGNSSPKTDEDVSLVKTDSESGNDTDVITGAGPCEQQYAVALADTGRKSDFTVSDPAGNGENIVTDNATGLIWQQVLAKTGFPWPQSVKYCENLTYGGSDDWHLPSPHELAAIVDYDNQMGSFYEESFPNTQNNEFWTSLLDAEDHSYAWAVQFSQGDIVNSPDINEIHIVMCVRRDSIVPFSGIRYTETAGSDSKVIVTDNLTKLEWTKEYLENKTWDEAVAYCPDLSYGGKDDWRLPGINELRGLVDYSRYNPAFNFPGMSNGHFWTSHYFAGVSLSAWFVYFNSGYVYYTTTKYLANVRCVRP